MHHQDVDADDLVALNVQVRKALQENKALRYVPSTKMVANITTAAKQQGTCGWGGGGGVGLCVGGGNTCNTNVIFRHSSPV